jgi:hypothetical protein
VNSPCADHDFRRAAALKLSDRPNGRAAARPYE